MMRQWFGLAILVWAAAVNAAGEPPLRLALSAVFVGEHADIVTRWQTYLQSRIQRPVKFVQRRSYKELNDLLSQGNLDAGWVCGAPYLLNRATQRLLAVPVWQGRPLYQSYLIVPSRDTSTRHITDLRGRVFAYSDPLSNSGYFVAQGELIEAGEVPKDFFSKTMFTYSHENSIRAVATGLVDGARVDGYVYETLRTLSPALIEKIRVVKGSREFGFPPIVARHNLPAADFEALQRVLLSMHQDEAGRTLLAGVGLDRFEAGSPALYEGIGTLLHKVHLGER